MRLLTYLLCVTCLLCRRDQQAQNDREVEENGKRGSEDTKIVGRRELRILGW